jgi:hypothetical protein
MDMPEINDHINNENMYKLKSTLLIFSLLILVNGSCKKIFRKDHSLTPEEYYKLGMPDQNKLSSNQDYVKVISVLYKLRNKNPLSYPRKHSKRSGAVFSCLINKENLSFANDTTLSLRDRALQIQSLSSLQGSEIQIYTDNLKSEQYYNEELIDLYIYGLYIREKMFELAGRINNSKSEADIAMKPGSGMVVNGYLSMVSLILAEQVRSRIYSTRDLKRLSLEVSKSLIENQQWFESADKQKISGEIQRVIGKSPSGYIKNNYQKAIKVLNN